MYIKRAAALRTQSVFLSATSERKVMRLADDDPRRLAAVVAQRGLRLLPHPRGDGLEDARMLAVGRGHDDGLAAVGGFADGDMQRHLAEEVGAQLLRPRALAPPWAKIWLTWPQFGQEK